MTMNRLEVFSLFMNNLYQHKLAQIDRLAPEVLTMDIVEIAQVVRDRVTDAYFDILADSILHPVDRQRAIDTFMLINVRDLLANPTMALPVLPPPEGVSETRVSDHGIVDDPQAGE